MDSQNHTVQESTAKTTFITEQSVPVKDIAEVLIAALEGGSNYWVSRITIHGGRRVQVPDGIVGGERVGYLLSHSKTARAAVHLDEGVEEDNEVYHLTWVNWRYGIQRAAQHRGQDVRSFIEDHDADDADLALQFALFDEVVFG